MTDTGIRVSTTKPARSDGEHDYGILEDVSVSRRLFDVRFRDRGVMRVSMDAVTVDPRNTLRCWFLGV